ncbi:MAG: hypothetical protein IPP94_16980 [Ignavibacteria bacterium]|nr:hypothetical protein [Ignavibacteria bacterium]
MSAFACIAMLAASFTSRAQNRWTPVTALSNGRVFTLCAASNGQVLAGCESGGLYISTDDGLNWTPHPIVQNVTVRRFFMHGTRIYAGLQNGLLLSSDNGNTWTDIPVPSGQNGFGVALNASGHLFIGGWEGVHRSTNGGKDWTDITAGLPEKRLMSLAISSADVLYAGLYRRGLYRSTDQGGTWTEADPSLTGASVNRIAFEGSKIYIASSDGVRISTDNGTSWEARNSGVTALNLECIVVLSAGSLAAAGSGGFVYTSSNDGALWTKSTASKTLVYDVIKTSSTLLAGTQWDGIRRSEDGAATWKRSDAGLTNLQVSDIAVSTSGTVLVCQNGGPLMLSSDGGGTWAASSENTAGLTHVAVSPDGSCFTAGYGGVLISTDGGRSFAKTSGDVPENDLSAVEVSPAGHVFVGGLNDKLFRSTNNGAAWTDVSNGLGSSQVLGMAWTATAMFVGTVSDGVYRSTDDGGTWSKLTITGASRIPAINADAGEIAISTGSDIRVSNDNGDSWSPYPPGIQGSIAQFARTSSSALVAAAWGVFAYDVVSSSTPWREFSRGLTNLDTRAIASAGGNVFYSGSWGGGVHKWTGDPLTGVSAVAVPSSFTIRVVPNPVRASARIIVECGSGDALTVAVHDLLGRRVAILADGDRPGGTVSWPFDASALTPGIYECRVSAGSAMRSVPLLVLR